MKTKLVPMLAGLLVLFSFGSVRNVNAGNFNFEASRSANESRIGFAPDAGFQFNKPANVDFTSIFDNFSNKSGNFDVAVNRDFNGNGNFDFAYFFDGDRFANGGFNRFDFENRLGVAFAGNFDNANANA